MSIYAGHDPELFLKLTYPFEDDMIATHLLHAFNALRSGDEQSDATEV